jgi:hypothetical protein
VPAAVPRRGRLRPARPRAGSGFANRSQPALLAVLLVAVTALGACGGPARFGETTGKLADAGALNPEVRLRPERDGAATVAVVGYRTRVEDAAATRREAVRLARVVWTTLPTRIDGVELHPKGPADSEPTVIEFSRAELERAHGRRPAGLDRSLADTGRDVLLQVLIGAGLLASLLALAAYLVVTLLRRRGPPQAGAPHTG